MVEGEGVHEKLKTERPPTYNLVMIDNRWAQVSEDPNTITYLDDGFQAAVAWDSLKLVKKTTVTLNNLLNSRTSGNVEISESELRLIKLPPVFPIGVDQDEVVVFGFYKSSKLN